MIKAMVKETLVEDNLNLAYYIAHRFQSYGIEFDDLVSICFVGLAKAANTYDPEKAKFATLAVMIMRNKVLMELRKKEPFKQSLDEELEDGKLVHKLIADPCDRFLLAEDAAVIREWYAKLPQKEKEIVYLVGVLEMNQTEKHYMLR